MFKNQINKLKSKLKRVFYKKRRCPICHQQKTIGFKISPALNLYYHVIKEDSFRQIFAALIEPTYGIFAECKNCGLLHASKKISYTVWFFWFMNIGIIYALASLLIVKPNPTPYLSLFLIFVILPIWYQIMPFLYAIIVRLKITDEYFNKKFRTIPKEEMREKIFLSINEDITKRAIELSRIRRRQKQKKKENK